MREQIHRVIFLVQSFLNFKVMNTRLSANYWKIPRERKKERERERKRKTERKREKERERDKEREREGGR